MEADGITVNIFLIFKFPPHHLAGLNTEIANRHTHIVIFVGWYNCTPREKKIILHASNYTTSKPHFHWIKLNILTVMYS